MDIGKKQTTKIGKTIERPCSIPVPAQEDEQAIPAPDWFIKKSVPVEIPKGVPV